MQAVFKVSELALWKKYTTSIKSCCNLKTSLFDLFNAAAESVNCSFFLKNLEKHVCNLTCIEDLPQHLLEKFIGDNSSITDIALRN